MKKIALGIIIVTITLLLVACGTNQKIKYEDNSLSNTEHSDTENPTSEGKIKVDKLNEMTQLIINDNYFKGMKNLKIDEMNSFYNEVLNMSREEYQETIENAKHISINNGEIYLFNVLDISKMEDLTLAAIDLKGTTISSGDKSYQENYLVISSENYLVLAVVNADILEDAETLKDICEKYFGEDNIDNMYELLCNDDDEV